MKRFFGFLAVAVLALALGGFAVLHRVTERQRAAVVEAVEKPAGLRIYEELGDAVRTDYRQALAPESTAEDKQAREARVAEAWKTVEGYDRIFERKAAELDPPLDELIESLPPGERLPPLETTGWEETAILGAAMAADPDAYVTYHGNTD